MTNRKRRSREPQSETLQRPIMESEETMPDQEGVSIDLPVPDREGAGVAELDDLFVLADEDSPKVLPLSQHVAASIRGLLAAVLTGGRASRRRDGQDEGDR